MFRFSHPNCQDDRLGDFFQVLLISQEISSSSQSFIIPSCKWDMFSWGLLKSLLAMWFQFLISKSWNKSFLEDHTFTTSWSNQPLSLTHEDSAKIKARLSIKFIMWPGHWDQLRFQQAQEHFSPKPFPGNNLQAISIKSQHGEHHTSLEVQPFRAFLSL